MKKIAILLALFVSTAVFAQPDDMKEKKERFDAMRVAHITEALDLSVEEAQVFWPIFNERNKKIEDLRRSFMDKMHKYRMDGKKIDDISDKELEELMKTKLDNEIKMAEVNKAYHQKFVDAVGINKTAKLYMAEMSFQRRLLEKSRGPKGGQGSGKGQGKGNGPNPNGYGQGNKTGGGPNCPNKY